MRFLALSLNNAQLWAPVVWKPSKISPKFLNYVCSDYLAMSQANLAQIGPRVFKSPMLRLEHPLKRTKNLLLIVNNSAVDWPISLKFDTYIDHMMPDLPHVFKVKGSNVKVTAWCGVLAPKTVTFHERIAWLSLNFVQTIPQHNATREKIMFKVIRSNFKLQ